MVRDARWLITIFSLVAAAACRTGDDAGPPHIDGLHATNALTASFDSCNATLWPGDTAGTIVGRGSTWSNGSVHNFGLFSLFVPDNAHIATTDTVAHRVTLSWASCPGCRFTAGATVDSTGRGMEGRVADILAAQRAIDSANRDPHAVQQFDDIDGPPRPFTTATGKGYIVDGDCGDCTSTSLLFGKPPHIASVDIGGDDDVPMLPRHVCEMIVIGKTLRWLP